MVMAPNFFQVDAFTGTPFAGNPAVVCLLNEPRDDRWLQHVAREMNVPTTAFLRWQKGGFDLRWFTPVVEIDLCGHATLASAHILWELEYLRPDEKANFYTLSGPLVAERRGDLVELNFPAQTVEAAGVPEHLVEALSIPMSYVGRSERKVYLVETDSEETVRAMKPDFIMLLQVPMRSVIVTSRGSTSGYDFVSRYFAPGLGIAEDAVTGSAHCALGPYWSKRLGQTSFGAYQASPRGGEIQLRVEGERVYLAGQAVTVSRGELLA